MSEAVWPNDAGDAQSITSSLKLLINSRRLKTHVIKAIT